MRKIMLKIIIASLLYMAIVICSVAQPTSGLPVDKAGRIEGSVSNGKGEPIEYVTVLLRQPQDSVLITGTTTSATGQYTFESVARGKYILTLTFVGYRKQSMAIELQDGANRFTAPEIILKEDTQLLGEVVVRGQKPLIEQEGGKLIFVVAAGGNAAELLQRTPGVSIDQNDQISLNGKTGVTIMIDGKITYLPPAELATLLRSMNANSIATVEVISNPSARYDAAGNSGMINIKMKKSTREGFNGSATVGTGYGRYGKANGNINLNYRTKKWAHFLNYGYVFDKRFYYAWAERISPGNGTAISFTQEIHRVQQLPSHTWQAGSEWQWNPRNSIAISTTGSYNERFTDNNSFVQIRAASAYEPDSTFTIANDQQYRWYNISGSVGYKHTFNRVGSELTVDFDHSTYGFNLNDNFIIKRFEKSDVYKNEYNVLSNQHSSFNIYTGRADYTHRLNEQVSFETGIKCSYVKTVNDIRFKNNLSGQYETDTIRSSDFKYAEQIGAGYVNVKTKLLGFDAQLGLRAEHTQYRGSSIRANKSIERNYFNVFPGITFNRNLTENYQLGLSYSYRIDRPTYKDLYPYVFYFDPFDSQFGNPTLLPQFTHNFQVSQTIAKDYVINFGYSSIAQYMAFAILLYENQVSSYAIKKNFDAFQNYYLTVIAPIRVTNHWTINCNLNLFYNNFNTQFLNEIYTSSRFSGIANVSQTITLPWGMTGEIVGVYNAPTVTGLFQNQALGSLNAGLQKQLFNKKATLRLNITDIFQTNRVRNRIEYPGLDMNIYVRNETRIVRLNFTYTMGKATGKASHRRNTLEDVQKRIGN
ncbi:MAG: outer membrane beta-barrel protein [Bacteroidetes bacterium]|nr:outer membrane beta-barrel protein [Bacteroidota bacterium]